MNLLDIRAIRQMLVLGKRQGFLTHDDINELLPDEVIAEAMVDDLFDLIKHHGILVVEDFKEWEDLRPAHEIYSEELPESLVEVVQTVNADILAYLKRHPEALHSIHWRLFEELVAEVLASFGWEVDLTQPTNDGGYDIFAISKDDHSGVRTSWVIECKRWSKTVGVDVARSLFSVKADLHAGMAMLATTSNFASGVHDLKASRYDLELKDFEGILEWLNEYKPNPEGRLYLKENRLVVPGDPEWDPDEVERLTRN